MSPALNGSSALMPHAFPVLSTVQFLIACGNEVGLTVQLATPSTLYMCTQVYVFALVAVPGRN